MMKNQALLSAETTIKIPFHDVDPARIVWHGHYAKYLEIARGVLLDKIDYNYDKMSESGYFWPVIDMHIRYIAPATFNQTIIVKATLKEWETRLLIEYLITDSETGKRLTKARTTQVAVSMDTEEMQFASPHVLHEKMNSLKL